MAGIRAAVLGVYAEDDSRITSGMDALDQALTVAGVTHEMKVYPGVGDAFHNDTGSRYNQEQDTLVWFERYVWRRQAAGTRRSGGRPSSPRRARTPQSAAGSRRGDGRPRWRRVHRRAAWPMPLTRHLGVARRELTP